jgi:PAS domain-containing protein
LRNYGIDNGGSSGQGWAKTLHPEDRDRVIGEWERAVKENRMFKSEYRWLRRDGTCVWVLGQSVALRDEAGEVTGYLGALSDITDRVQVEAELRQYKENLEQLVEARTVELGQAYAQLQETKLAIGRSSKTKTELICRFTPDGTLTFVNPAYCRYFNKKDSELVGKTFMPMIPEEDWAAAETALANLTPENPVFTIEHRLSCPMGRCAGSNGPTEWFTMGKVNR